MRIKLKNNLEVLFGLFGVLIFSAMLILALIFSPNYLFFEDYISDLAFYSGKLFFSIGFAIFGVFLVPFFIVLERELVNINENMRRAATVIAIITCTCFTLGSIIPEESYLNAFFYFHAFIAFFAFFNSGIYIFLFSFLMFLSLNRKDYSGPKFHIFLAVFGFITAVGDFVLILFFYPILEWFVVLSILLWIFITGIHLLKHESIRVPIVEFKRLDPSHSLELFKVLLKKVDELQINDEILIDAIENNINFFKNKINEHSD